MGWFIPALIAGASALASKSSSKGGGEYSQQPSLSPEQRQFLSQYMNQLKGPVSNMGSLYNYDLQGSMPYQQGYSAVQDNLRPFDPTRTQDAFNANVADPSIRQFNERILPELQQRYIQQGAARSSAFGANAAHAGTDLMSRLSGQRYAALAGAEQMAGQRQLNASQQALGYGQAPGQANLAQQQALSQSMGVAVNPNYQQTTFNPGQQSPMPGVLGALGGYMGYNGKNGSLERANLYSNLGMSFGGLF